MEENRYRKKERRVYGQDEQGYDNLFFGLIKTKADRKKEKQNSSQRDANINLTRHKSEEVLANAKAANFNAEAARLKAIAAERLAATATTELEGAQATVQLKNAGLAVAGLLILGIIGVAVYVIRENKKAANLEAELMKVKAAPTPNYKQ